MNRPRIRLAGALSALILAVALTGCGEDTSDDADSQSGTQTQTETAAPDADGASVATADSDLGTILTDGDGRTLYLFTQDSPGTSACVAECLDAWPILEGEASAGDGVDANLLGTIERSDGTVQATYNEWPLYHFAQDVEPGDLNGQGVNDVWWVLDPEGNAIEQMPETGEDDGGRDY
ncbi:MAG: COG4315 family predicted lipoprotein [Haloechinothrix sp.]